MIKKCKVSDLARDLNITSKELIALFDEHLQDHKKASAVLSEEEINIALEIYSPDCCTMDNEDYITLRKLQFLFLDHNKEKNAEYLLEVFGGPAGKGSYSELFKYEIDSTRTAYKPLHFPTAYADYRASDMELIKPLYDPLIRGDLVNFELKTTSFDKLYVVSPLSFPITHI